MRYTWYALGLLAALVLISGTATRAEDKKADPADEFFNGKDLTGWEGLTDLWSVKDGAIVGSTPKDGWKGPNTFLCSKKKYTDFELSCQVRLKDGAGNSGVQIRSKLLDDKDLAGKFVVAGPQPDMATGYWGSLYGERFDGMKFGGGKILKMAPADVVKKVVKEKDFNDYYVKCVGKHITIKLNGETTVDDDFPGIPDDGIIAWQLHAGGHMEVTFKDIKFKDLSKK